MSPHPRALVCLAALIPAVELCAQAEQDAAKQAFGKAFIAAVRGQDLEGLIAIRPLIDQLAPELQARARFGLGVRLGEIHLVKGDLKRAAKECLVARTRARADAVYSKSLRPLVLVILWQALPEGTFLDLLDQSEREYLRSEQPLIDAKHMRVPIELIRSDIEEDEKQFAAALERVLSLAEELRASGLAKSDLWRQKVVLRLFWLHFIRREYDSAKLYLRDLPAASSLWPRALLALRQRDYVTAEKAARRLAKRDRQFRHILADVLEELDRFAEAKAIYETMLGEIDPMHVALAKRGLGDCILGRWSRDPSTVDAAGLQLASKYYREALTTFEGEQTARMLVEQSEALRQLAAVFEARGEPQPAHALYVEAIARAERGREIAGADTFGSSWYAKTSKHDYLASVDGIMRCASAVGQDPLGSMLALEVGKARTLLDWIDQPPQIDDRSRVRSAVRSLTYSTDTEAARRLAAERGSSASGPAPVISRDQLEQMFESLSDAFVLSYWLGTDTCWLVWRGGVNGRSVAQGCIALGSSDLARKLLNEASSVVRSPDREPQDALRAAAEFFLPASLRAQLGDTGLVVFCPDAELGRLPFEALPVAGQALGISHRIERAPSLTVRQRLAQRHSSAARVLIVDSIDDTASAGLGVDPLRSSAREGMLVARSYSGVTRLQGSDASLEGLRVQLSGSGFDLVHLNAHAVAARIPTASVLVLQDGPVSIASLSGLPVDGAFVVLSACSSGAGEMRGGEGELGLLGWPLASGARGAAASLWSVNQQATADLMGQFHHHRAKGVSEAEAMRAARAALASTDNYSHPYYWAGFGIYASSDEGDVDGPLVWYLSIGFVLMLGLGFAWRRRVK